MAERNLIEDSTGPDPGNAGGGKCFNLRKEVFFMEKDKSIIAPILGLVFSLIAKGILFLNVLTYKTIEGQITAVNTLHFYDMFNLIKAALWCPILILSIAVLSTILPLLGLKFKKCNESFCIISTILLLLLICFLIIYKEIFSLYAAKNIPNFAGASLGYGSGISIFLFALVSICSLSSSNIKFGDNVKSLSEDGIFIALAFVLNFVKIPLGPAGSINFQMLPLFIIAIRRGPIHAFISGGLVFGVMTCLCDGYGFATYPFDYLIGFGSVAILGLFNKPINKSDLIKGEIFLFIGCLLATLVRYIGGTTSSMVVYGYSFVNALIYNATYIPISGLIATIAVMLLLPLVKVLNKRYPAN